MSVLIPKGSVIVSFIYKKSNNLEGYYEMDKLTIKEVEKNPGYIAHELYTNNDKNIFISYWKNLSSIEKWKNNKLHIEAKKMGKIWYETHKVQISKLKNDYYFD